MQGGRNISSRGCTSEKLRCRSETVLVSGMAVPSGITRRIVRKSLKQPRYSMASESILNGRSKSLSAEGDEVFGLSGKRRALALRRRPWGAASFLTRLVCAYQFPSTKRWMSWLAMTRKNITNTAMPAMER